MKKPSLVIVSVLFLLFLAIPVMAIFGRVVDYDSYHHICYYLNDVTYNFIINHSQSDSWPCGSPEITNTYVRIPCVSYYDGAHLGKYVGCRGGQSCARFSFNSSNALGVHTNSEEPSWGTTGNLKRTVTYGGYSYYEYETTSFDNARDPVPNNFYGGGTCPATVIQSTSPTNDSTSTSKTTTITITTDISAVCRYSNISGLDFSNMALFTNTNSTSHSFSFNASDVTNYTFYLKCNNTLGDVNEEDYLLKFLVDYNNPPNITSIPITNGTELELYTYNVTAVDADGDTVSFSDNASLFNINQVTGLINFTPTIGGNYTIKITVSDGTGSTIQIYNLSIELVNHAPVIDPIGNLTAIVNQTFTEQITATDPDGDGLTFLDSTSLFDINTNTGLINFTPTVNGTYKFNITVIDNNSLNPKNATENGWLIVLNENGTDVTSPNVTVINPINGSTITTNSTWLNVTTNESAVCTFHGEGCPVEEPETAECDEVVLKNMSKTNGTSHSHYLTNLLSNLTYNITVNCQDDSENSNSKSVTFYVAFPQPGSSGGGGGESGGGSGSSRSLLISPVYPKNNSIVSDETFLLKVSTHDKYATCSYNLNSGAFTKLDTSISMEGDAWSVKTSTKDLDMSEELITNTNRETLRNITTFIGKDELDVLADGEVSNTKATSPYHQYLDLLGPGASDNTGFVAYLEDDNDITADFLYFRSGDEIAKYKLEFTTSFESDVDDSAGKQTSTGTYLTDYEDVDITMLGKTYTIVQARRNSVVGDGIKLILIGGAIRDTLLEGEIKTYTIEGKDFETTLDFVSSTQTKFTINGEATRLLGDGDTDKLSDGTEVGISEILYQDYAGGIHSTTFYLGAQKMELKDTQIADGSGAAVSSNNLKVGDNSIDDAHIVIEGSDDNSTFKIDTITINMTADDDFYVPVGGKLSELEALDEPEVLFTNQWDVEYRGLKDELTEDIEITTSGLSRYNLKFKDGHGENVNLPLAEAVGDSKLKFGKKDMAVINRENLIITKNDYLVLTDSSKKRGERKTHILQYKGADKFTADIPILKFKDLGFGTTINKIYSDSTPLAILKLGGADYRVYRAPGASVSVNDFDIQVDLDADGTLEATGEYIPITTQYGAEVKITNETAGRIDFTIKTPDDDRDDNAKDSVDTLQATDLTGYITANSGSVNLQRTDNLRFRTPNGQTNVAYAYTSYGAFITHKTPLSEPATLKVEYPQRQRVSVVHITGKTTTNYQHLKQLSNLTNGLHTVQFNCSDAYGTHHTSNLIFTVMPNPTITSYYPENGQYNTTVKTNIIMNFSEAVRLSTLMRNVIIRDDNGNKVKGVIKYNTILNQAVFDPFLTLKYNTMYTISLSNIEDLSGNHLDKDYVWNFTTALKDTDNDGVPDHEDSDIDNDGIDDNFDPLRGSLSNINSDFINLSMKIDEDKNISKVFNGTKKVKFYFGGKKLLEFDFNFNNNSMLDLTNISILNASNSTLGGVVISGIDLSGNDFTKTAYMEKINAGLNGVCIKDEEIQWIDNITDLCNGNNEFKVECDGSSQSGYSCTYNSSSNLYKVTGLTHSGARQLSYSKPSDEQQNNDDDGSSGGGGGGFAFTCNMDWKCSEWSECKDEKQTRKCNFVKVPQHASKTRCPSKDKASSNQQSM